MATAPRRTFAAWFLGLFGGTTQPRALATTPSPTNGGGHVAPETGTSRRPPSGESGSGWTGGGRNLRPEPLNDNPDQYTQRDWSDALDRASRDPKFGAGTDVRGATWLNADILAAAPEGDTTSAMSESVDVVNTVFGWDGKPGLLERGWPDIMDELAVVADLKGASIGEERWGGVGGVTALLDIEQRHLGLVDGWGKDERGRINAVHMRKPGLSRACYSIPLYADADVAGGGVHFAFGRVGDPEGRLAAVLGRLVDWESLKAHMTREAWKGVSRWATPVVNAVLRAEIVKRMGMELDSATIEDMVARAQAACIGFMAGDADALSSSDVIGLEPFGGELNLESWVKLCSLVDHQGLIAIGTPDMAFGSEPNGSHSAAEQIADLLLRVVQSRMLKFLGQLRSQCVRRVVRFNLGPLAPLPMLIHEGIDVDGLAGAMGNLPSLVNSKILWKDAALRRKVRRSFGLPKEGPDAAPVQPGDVMGQYYPTELPPKAGPGRGNKFMPNGEPAPPGTAAPEAP
jgi:hypothetical protein